MSEAQHMWKHVTQTSIMLTDYAKGEVTDPDILPILNDAHACAMALADDAVKQGAHVDPMQGFMKVFLMGFFGCMAWSGCVEASEEADELANPGEYLTPGDLN